MRRFSTLAALLFAAIPALAQTPITPAAPGPWQFTASATVTHTDADPNTNNNTSPAVVTSVASVAGIPTASEWGLLALLAALLGLALLKLR